MMKIQGRWTNRTLCCGVVACSLFGYGGLAGAQQTDTDETASILTFDHDVPHISTVPANKGEAVNLFVRERVRKNSHDGKPRKAVLLIHGFSVPGLPGFELKHDHHDWALALARAGLDVFMLDFQGSGRSPRPTMDDPCNVPEAQQSLLIPNPLPAKCKDLDPPRDPTYSSLLINAQSDWDELDTVVDYIRNTRGVEKVALVGWSHASVRIGPYAVQHPEKVDSLFFLAPIFSNAILAARQVGTTFLPPYKLENDFVKDCTAQELTAGTCPANVAPSELRLPGTPMTLFTRQQFMSRWNSEIKAAQDAGCENHVEAGIQDVVWSAIMENDELGRKWGPPSPESTEGVLRVRTFALWGWNSRTVARISVPVLVVGGEFDNQAPPARLSELYSAIPDVPKLLFKVACAGHSIPWERQSTFLHDISKQWLKDGAVEGLTNGKFFVDTEGNLTPIP